MGSTTPNENSNSNNNQFDLQQQQPRSRITKATASTTAVQPLEIITTAVVNCSGDEEQKLQQQQLPFSDDPSSQRTANDHKPGSKFENDRSESDQQPQQQQRRNDARRKQSHHHHRHRIKSPVFQADGSVSPLASPLSSAGGGGNSTVVTPSINHDSVIFSELPPPIIKEGPSEAIVALQDAANESNAPSSSSPGATTPTSLNNTSFIYSPTAILSDVASPIGIVTENDVLTSQQRQHNHRRRGSSSSGRHSNGNSSNTKSSSKTTRAATTTAIAPIKTTAAATKRISKEEYYSYYYDGSIDQLFESCFFSAVLLLQWSNVMGPKMVKVWSSADDEAAMDEKLQTLIGRQVLNGEMGRSISEDGGGVELKWITLHRQGILCAAFLYNDRNNGGSSGSSALSALVFILPLRYLRNFSPYFHVLRDRVPLLLIQPLKQIRKLSRRRNISGSTALDFFARRCLAPFIQSIMEIESVSLPLECNKISYNLLDQESRQLFDSPFFGRVVTSHLQTYASSVLLGNSLTTMNMMINTLSLFLSPDERNRSSHARKSRKYMADLYLQGLLIQDVERMRFKLEVAVLESNVPTTIVDMSRLLVKQTPLLPAYRKLQKEYRDWVKVQLEDDLSRYLQPPSERSASSAEWKKQSTVFHKVDRIAPMVKSLLDEIQAIPTRLREAYVRQWRRWLVRLAVAFIQFSKNEGFGRIDKLKDALQLHDQNDFLIVLAQAEKLKPGLVEKLNIHVP